VLKNSYQLGLEAEKQAQIYFEKKGYELLRHRWRTPFAEVDLVFRHKVSRHILLVEVKKNSYLDFREKILSKRQKTRLGRVVQWLSEKNKKVELRLVVIDEKGEIEEFPDVFG
jgi:Holliday junction resolvase-like predicted endonuclease